MKKILYNIMLLFATVTMLSSCNKDGDLVFLNGLEGSELTATTNDVVLSIANSKKLVLSLEWNNPTLLTSDSSKTAPDGVLKTYLQVSANEDFSGKINESSVNSPSKAYRGDALNSVAKDLGLEAEKSSPLYFRIKSVEGNNIEPSYSNIEKVNVTPFTIHMNFISVLDQAKTDTVARLYSDSENGIYTGYMKAAGWYNCWFVENDGTVWGNYNVSGHEFELSKASDAWNCWFADGRGDWYVTVDTKDETWSAANITKVTINGNDFTYDTKKAAWSAEITTTADNARIGGTATANEYNTTTRTSSSVEKTITLPDTILRKAGLYTVYLKINNHAQYSYEIVSGSVKPDDQVKLPSELAMYSEDGNTKLATLAETSTGKYAGTYVAKHYENFQLVDEENQIWYGSDPKNQFTLDTADSKYKLWFNNDITDGTTVNITVDLNAMTWGYTK